MNRIYLRNYAQLPILATRFWKIPKFDEKRREVFNKTVKFQKKDFYAICYFSHEHRRTNELDVKSNLEIIYKENKIDEMEFRLEPMKFFVLPGGHASVSFGHVARTVCRRAERLVTALDANEKVEPLVIQYLNRLSDYVFVLCRMMTKDLKISETPWRPKM